MRQVHAEGQRERQNMRDAARSRRERGPWMVVAKLPSGRESVASVGYDTASEAREAARTLRDSETAGYQNSKLRIAKEE